jgi:protein-disulfide isomerase
MKFIRTFGFLLMVACAALIIPHQAQAEAFTAEQKEELKKLFEAYILENPETIMKSVDQYRMQQEQKTTQDAQANLAKHKDYLAGKDLPTMGNPEGSITLVEFFDYNCGYCKRMFEDLIVLTKEDKDLRVVLKELPILSPASAVMARFALAAHKQGKYFEMHQALMQHRGAQTEEAFIELAQKIGLDAEKLKADMNDPSIQQALDKSREIATDLGIQGTPGIIIGDQIYRGYIGLDGVKASLKEVREKKPAQ